MLTKYKNQLYDLIKDSDFLINDFKFETSENKESGINTYTLFHIGNNMKFIIEESRVSYHKFRCWFTKFEKSFPKLGPIPRQGYKDFDEVATNFNKWLHGSLLEYKTDNEEIDYWNSIQGISFKNIDFNDNSPFNQEEKKELILGLNEAKELINQELNISPKNLQEINSRIQYLVEAVDRNNKTDWKTLTIGTIIGIVTNLGIDTDTGKEILNLFSKLLEQIPELPL